MKKLWKKKDGTVVNNIYDLPEQERLNAKVRRQKKRNRDKKKRGKR